jgi:hypothetical protein
MTRAARVVWTSRAPPFSLRAWGWGGKMSQSPGLWRLGAGWVPVGVACAPGGGQAHFSAVLGGGGLESFRVGLGWGAGK